MSQVGAAVNNIASIRPEEGLKPNPRIDKSVGGQSFDSVFKGQLSQLSPASAQPIKASTLKFSAHAIDRLKSRGISFDPQTLQKLEDAVEKAAMKGAKESLILTDDSALIVSVKNRTVITAMDKNAMKENVFTNIDSTVMI